MASMFAIAASTSWLSSDGDMAVVVAVLRTRGSFGRANAADGTAAVAVLRQNLGITRAQNRRILFKMTL